MDFDPFWIREVFYTFCEGWEVVAGFIDEEVGGRGGVEGGVYLQGVRL